MKRLLGWCCGLVMAASSAQAADFLDPDQAFGLTVKAVDASHLEVQFEVAPGYHLYRERFGAVAEPAETRLGALQVPAGHKEFDSALQQTVEVFRQPVTLKLPLDKAPAAPFMLRITHQGCADEGLCYAPAEHAFEVAPAAGGGSGLAIRPLSEAQAEAWKSLAAMPFAGVGAGVGAGATAGSAGAPAAPSGSDESGRFESALQSRSLPWVAGVFVLAGLLLSFTPCVLPMLPILSSIIVGQAGRSRSRWRGFSLAAAYSLGMALVYTAIGMAAGLMGEGLAAALQNAWVLGAFALLLVGLSLSMFGLYEIQLPSGLQSRLNQASGRFQGGRHAGVFAMGALSALMVGPCVAAPLAGALVYISRTHDVWLGGIALFALATGMSVPLLLLGASAGSLLPRSGLWMERVKHVFGFMLLAVALWMVSPVLPAWALMLLSALLLLTLAVYLGAFERLDDRSPGPTMSKGFGLALGALALLQLVGVVSGGRDPWQPLRHLASSVPVSTAAAADPALPQFHSVNDLPALEAAVAGSAKPVLVDLYADWCTSCKELEAFTFSDEVVRKQLADFTLLRVDVTANNAEHKALMRRFGLFGPPAMLFFKPAGAEINARRVVGFLGAREFSAHLAQLR